MHLGRGSVVFITGGGSGIGLALARRFLARDCSVTICGRDTEKLEAAERDSDGLSAVRCDVTQNLDVLRMRDLLTSQYGRVDVLVNNAGIQRTFEFAEDPDALEKLEEEVRTNFLSQVRLIRAFLPLLIASDAPVIVNVTSVLAMLPKRSAPGYCASKAALHSFTRTLAWQLEGTGIAVLELLPPLVDTPMTRGKPYRVRPMRADLFAEAALRGIEKGRREIRPGKAWLFCLGARLFPGLLERFLRQS
ncbi:SDR family NAD(P)-dependent oxidoreductase [Candidatus Fermentibacterales bacterium]|nr:SDR family NAD(P)-dependent oxidoreductase [Candidatus Fermentibacterales bacterium]